MLLSGDGRVFSWGSGNFGHLGHGNLRDRYAPLWVDKPLRGINITNIACYECHSAAISGIIMIINNYMYKSSSLME